MLNMVGEYLKRLKENPLDKSTVLDCAALLRERGEIDYAWKLIASYCSHRQDDVEVIEALRELERIRILNEPSGTKLSFIHIVLNGMPFLEYSLKSIYDFAHQIIIVEGAVENCMFAANPDGSSKDGTVEFIKSFPDPDKKIKLIQGCWPEKCEMTNAALEYVTGNYIWLIASDEVYRGEDIRRLVEMIRTDFGITQIGLIPYNFWKGFDYIFESPHFSEKDLQYQGPIKYIKGARFINHRPPQLKYPGYMFTADGLNRVDGTQTKKADIQLFHYSYVLDEQVKQKIELYKRYGWGKSWGVDIENWHENCFLKWTPENRKEIEANYPVWTGDRNSHTVLFTGRHPEVMKDFIEQYRTQKVMVSSPNSFQIPDLVKAKQQTVNYISQQKCWPKAETLPVIGCTCYQKKVLEAWNFMEIDQAIEKKKNLILQNIEQNKPFWNIHVALSFLADRLNPKNYLEIGVRTGGSLIALLHNCDVKKVVAVDTWSGSYADLPNTLEYTVGQINKYKAGTNKQFKIEFIKGNSHKVLRELVVCGRKFDLITVDGDHTEEGAWQDLEDAHKLLADKGAIVFDDIIHPSHLYLKNVSDRFQQAHPEYKVLINCEQDNGCVIFLKNIDVARFLNEKSLEFSNKRNKCVRVAADYVQTGVTVDSGSSFAASIQKVLADIRPKKVIETGTYLGTGTTTIIAKSLEALDIHNAVFFTIEVNPCNYAQAKNYFEANNMRVNALNGLSVPRSMLPSKDQIAAKTITDVDYDGIFADHKECDRVRLYCDETNFPDVSDNLLYKCLKALDFRPDFVLLDSGGHMGDIEFGYLIENLNGQCYIALDDIYHVKHHRSFKQIQSDDRFKIVAHSDEKFGFCIARFTPQKKISGTRIKNLLWVRTDSIGDNVLSASMLPYIREKYKDAQITVLCQEHIVQLYENCPYVDGIVAFNRKRALEDKPYREEIVSRLLTVRPDMSLNSVYSREQLNDFFALKCCANQRVAMEGNLSNIPAEIKCKFDPFYTRLLPSNGEHKPELERHRDFLKGLGIDVQHLQPVVWISPEDENFAERFFRENRLNPDKTIALFAGVQDKCRLYDKYGTGISQLCKDRGFKIVTLGAEHDYAINQKNLDTIDVESINLSGKTSLLESAAILKRCHLAVGAETGLAHICCAVGTPNVILLGGGYFGRFMPYTPLTSIVCLPLACYGCNWGCRYENYYCVRDVVPEIITEAVRSVVGKSLEKPRVFVQDNSLWHPRPWQPVWKLFERFLDAADVEVIGVGEESLIAHKDNLSSHARQLETVQDVRCQGGLEIQGDNKLTIVTSIAPRNLERQTEMIESWRKLGLDVVSINCVEEIEMLRQAFPDVKFVQAKRDGRETFGKPVIYLDDVFEHLWKINCEFCGIVNSDMYLFGDEGIVSFIKAQARDSLVYGSRMDADSLEVLDGRVYEDGFDFFFFHKSLIPCFPKSDFCIGLPWWDYWVPLIPALKGIQIRKLDSLFAYHIKHPSNWNGKQWSELAKRIFEYLQGKIEENSHLDSDDNPWALLGRMCSTYQHCYLRAKGMEDKSKMSIGIVFPCILEFLKTKSIRIVYSGDKSAASQVVAGASKK